MAVASEPCVIETGARSVSGLIDLPDSPRAIYLLAHGAGAGMRHPFLARIAGLFAAREIGTVRYQFPYMEDGKNRPDSPQVATATVRAACAFAAGRWPELPLFAGGKSFGGRMTSTAFAERPLEGVRGLVFLGFPLHAPKRPAATRAEHLDRVGCPMLFLQGTRDDLADLSLLGPIVGHLGPRATLHVIDTADHSFNVLKSGNRTPEQVMAHLADIITDWIRSTVA